MMMYVREQQEWAAPQGKAIREMMMTANGWGQCLRTRAQSHVAWARQAESVW